MRSALYPVKLKFGGDIWGGYVPYFFPDGIFYSDRRILHFIYLIKSIGQRWRIQNLPSSLSRHDFSKFSSSHEIMVEDVAGPDYMDKVAKRAVEIIFLF